MPEQKQNETGFSPLPQINKNNTDKKVIDFLSAMKEIIKGKKITKEEWIDKNIYGFLKDEKLMINLKNGEHYWVLSLADIQSEDYYVIN